MGRAPMRTGSARGCPPTAPGGSSRTTLKSERGSAPRPRSPSASGGGSMPCTSPAVRGGEARRPRLPQPVISRTADHRHLPATGCGVPETPILGAPVRMPTLGRDIRLAPPSAAAASAGAGPSRSSRWWSARLPQNFSYFSVSGSRCRRIISESSSTTAAYAPSCKSFASAPNGFSICAAAALIPKRVRATNALSAGVRPPKRRENVNGAE
mmetsp:Transcript_19673/g.61205  ORF Transcript_19673/g.61205 Transcript_19673/m.61205 type:complete len:211 (+) Transcript_19673:359-991(+)